MYYMLVRLEACNILTIRVLYITMVSVIHNQLFYIPGTYVNIIYALQTHRIYTNTALTTIQARKNLRTKMALSFFLMLEWQYLNWINFT